MTSSPDPRAALEALIFANEGPSSIATIRRALPGLSPACSAGPFGMISAMPPPGIPQRFEGCRLG